MESPLPIRIPFCTAIFDYEAGLVLPIDIEAELEVEVEVELHPADGPDGVAPPAFGGRMSAPRAKRPTPAVPAAGSLILVGAPGYSLPGDWLLAKVLWADNGDVLIEHNPPSNSGTYRQVIPLDHVRKAGSIDELGQFQREAREAIAGMARKVREAQNALGAAREAVWQRLDEINASVSAEELA